MKNILNLLLLLLPFSLVAQTGKVFDNLSLPSKILNMDRNYSVYLPPDYETSSRSYPVLYLLHGATDDHTGWVQFGEVKYIADKAIKEGKATPMIIVMPDADTGRMGYFNSIKGDWQYEDFFFEELIPHVEKKFRIKGKKEYRAIAGLSMGGGGTFMYALHHPELFSSACPLSASTGPASIENSERYTKWMRIDKEKKEDIEAYLKKHSALMLIEDMNADEIKKVRWFIDCGDDDFLYEGNSLVHIALRKKKVPHEFRIRDGGHGWTYWRESLPNVLSFVSDAFHKL